MQCIERLGNLIHGVERCEIVLPVFDGGVEGGFGLLEGPKNAYG